MSILLSVDAQNWVYLWIVVLLATVILEAVTMQLTCIWFTFGALGAWILSLCGAPLWSQFLVFALLSLLLLVLTRPIAIKYLKPKIVRMNADAVPGKTGVITEAVHPDEGTGLIKVEGQIWSAKPEDGKKTFEVGDRVKVVRIEGVKAVIRSL